MQLSYGTCHLYQCNFECIIVTWCSVTTRLGIKYGLMNIVLGRNVLFGCEQMIWKCVIIVEPLGPTTF